LASELLDISYDIVFPLALVPCGDRSVSDAAAAPLSEVPKIFSGVGGEWFLVAFRNIASLPNVDADRFLCAGRFVVEADFRKPFFKGTSLMNSTDS
jgi:hypothetical protein